MPFALRTSRLSKRCCPNTLNWSMAWMVSSHHPCPSQWVSHVVATLLSQGADLEQVCWDTGATPLKYAIIYTQVPVLKQLIAAGADVNNAARGQHPLTLTNDEMREMGISGTQSQYAEIESILTNAGTWRPSS